MKTYAAVGTGVRVAMFLDPIAKQYRENTRLVGLCDPSPTRLVHHQSRLSKHFGYDTVPLYPIEKFDDMLKEQKPDSVIVCTVDSAHHEYILRSVAQGCDVVCEKPITTDVDKCRQILQGVRQSGRKVQVTFNMRWQPGKSAVYELLRSGVIGRVMHVSMDYLLDTCHGADYFRRWHSEMDKSGGLLVHKSTHHFDVVNWWIDSIPETIHATGRLAFYGKENAIARGDQAFTTYDRYTGTQSENDPFRLDLDSNPGLRALYLDAEADSGYIRDRNVFRDGIDIYDTMSVLVNYRNGVTLNYSLNAFCPYEGVRVAFTGDRGRLEYSEFPKEHCTAGGTRLHVYPHFATPYEVEIAATPGGHGGADPRLQEQIFSGRPPVDTMNRWAGHEQGVASAIIGIAANQSIVTGKPVQVSDLVTLPHSTVRLSELT